MSGEDRAALLAAATRRLAAAGVDDPARDARLLMRWASGLDGAALSAALRETPPPEVAARFEAAVAARAARRPLSHVTGRRIFWGREFEVTPDTLDPRPETETLIAAALDGTAPGRVLDLGLGTGCILLTLLAEWPFARGVGVEVSAPALEVARRNAARLGVADRADLRAGDWYAGLDGRFDLIVSNPPYIPAAEMAGLSPEVREHEPGGGADAGRGRARRLSRPRRGALRPAGARRPGALRVRRGAGGGRRGDLRRRGLRRGPDARGSGRPPALPGSRRLPFIALSGLSRAEKTVYRMNVHRA